jgi:diguanylate cyclase (GGDEF)-like protein
MHLALARSQRTGQLLAICMLDLDGFKPVNDKFGHEVGDQLLIKVAHRLQASVRGDDTVARMGGDEFVLLLGGLVSVKEADEALTRILQVIAAPYRLVSDHAITISASIGVSLYPSDENDPDTLLRHADHAMYLAKEGGKNRYHLFNPALEERERDNRETLRLICKAANENQFTLFYQPIVDCRQGVVVSMEALLRWNHPILGLMGPAEFLPLIEDEDDLAKRVGEWVMRHALAQAATWRRAGFDIPVSVNVFVQQLRDPDFPDLLQQLLAEHPELPPNSLTIEILENTALDDFASVVRLIETSARFGVRYALDDFGTGFSSLTYLRRLPVSSLKIGTPVGPHHARTAGADHARFIELCDLPLRNRRSADAGI